MSKLLLAVIFFTALTSGTLSYAASFSCDGELRPVEALICSDSQLQQADETLSERYQELQFHLPAPQQALLKKNQREWLKQEQFRCEDVACLKAAYKLRNRIFESMNAFKEGFQIQKTWGTVTVQLHFDANERLDTFNQSTYMQHYDADSKLSYCHTLISLKKGNGSPGYGAVCEMKAPTWQDTWMVCDHEMTSHFSVQGITSDISHRELALFVSEHCL